MRTINRTLVAELLSDVRVSYDADSQQITWYQPLGTPVKNDGIRFHWVTSGERYQLKHDGTGWRVTNDLWDNHVRRLADETGAFVAALPTADGPLVLDEAAEYEIQHHLGLKLYQIS